MITTHSNISKKMGVINVPPPSHEGTSTHYGAEREVDIFNGNGIPIEKDSSSKDHPKD